MIEARIEGFLRQMTLEEKVSMVAGSTMWNSTGVERLGIPTIKVTDGPNGARGGQLFGGALAGGQDLPAAQQQQQMGGDLRTNAGQLP